MSSRTYTRAHTHISVTAMCMLLDPSLNPVQDGNGRKQISGLDIDAAHDRVSYVPAAVFANE